MHAISSYGSIFECSSGGRSEYNCGDMQHAFLDLYRTAVRFKQRMKFERDVELAYREAMNLTKDFPAVLQERGQDMIVAQRTLFLDAKTMTEKIWGEVVITGLSYIHEVLETSLCTKNHGQSDNM